ncbi:MAG: hypothetical protein ACYDBQ_06840 [Thermoplasmatota archaeon]
MPATLANQVLGPSYVIRRLDRDDLSGLEHHLPLALGHEPSDDY